MSFLRAGGTLRCIKNEPAARLRAPLISFVAANTQPKPNSHILSCKPPDAAAIRSPLYTETLAAFVIH